MPPPKKTGRNPLTTLAVVASCLVLSVPVGGVAINLESTFMPPMPLKDPSAILNASHIALFAGAYMTIINSVVVSLGAIIIRHMSPNNTLVGLVQFGFSVINFIAQLFILGLVYISNQLHLESKNPDEIRFVNGQYDLSGKQFSRESFSCMMDNLFPERETWAENACSEYHYARYTTIIMTVAAFLIVTIAYWPVRKYIFGRNKDPYSGASKA